MRKRLHILATGRVQGVFFRATAKRIADTHNLRGYAKNLRDGKVEIVAEGEESGLRALLDWCYRGSLMAHVEGLSYEWQEAKGEHKKFEVEREKGNLVLDQVHAFTNLGRRVLNRVDRTVEEKVLPSATKKPKHVVIIPDGNRRWAHERGLPSWKGHAEGLERTKELLKMAEKDGIKNMTFWGFSTENWSRDEAEVNWLMKVFKKAVSELGEELVKTKTGFRHLGRKDRLEKSLSEGLAKLEEETKEYKNKTFAMALDYGGRDELIRAANSLEGEKITEENMSAALDTAGLPDPDLIIRTSGEQRLSGMMPWQGTYAELYFTPLHFPDFTPAEFQLALSDFNQRQRRFGG